MDNILQQQDLKFDAKPKKFVVWLFVVSSTIMFGGFTSYYIVFAASKGKGHGLVLPDAFMYSTAILLGSSISVSYTHLDVYKRQSPGTAPETNTVLPSSVLPTATPFAPAETSFIFSKMIFFLFLLMILQNYIFKTKIYD